MYEKLSTKFKSKELNSKIANFVINKVLSFNSKLEDNLKSYLNLDKNIPEDIVLQINKVFKENQKAVNDFKSGKENAIFFLIGQVIQKIGNKIDIEKLKTIIIEELKK